MVENKNTIIVVAVIALLALVATSGNLTGFVPRADRVTSLSAVQDGVIVTVTINPVGGTGNPGKRIDMRLLSGTKLSTAETRCDDQGKKGGTSKCVKEVARFDIRGSEWNAGDRVQFNVRGTDIKSPMLVLR